MRYQYENLYKILNVPETSSSIEIKKSYRILVRKYHPDLNPNTNTVNKIQELSYAYSILSKKDERARYDSYLRSLKKGGSSSKATSSSKTKEESIYLRSIFDSNINAYKIFITGLQAKYGCNGYLKIKLKAGDKCTDCNGKGYKTYETHNDVISCMSCHATGKISSTDPSYKRINIKIRKGIMDGTKFKVDPFPHYFYIFILKNPYVSINGLNIEMKVPISPIEQLGDTYITIPNIVNGEYIKVYIPVNFNVNNILKVANYGISKDGKHGDLYLKCFIKYPNYSSMQPNIKNLIKQIQKELNNIHDKMRSEFIGN